MREKGLVITDKNVLFSEKRIAGLMKKALNTTKRDPGGKALLP